MFLVQFVISLLVTITLEKFERRATSILVKTVHQSITKKTW